MATSTTDPLTLVVVNNGLDVSENAPILQPFLEFLALAEEWKTKVATIKVTDVSQVREMKLAKETRLALKEIRVNSNKKRIALKDESLKRGRMIDGLHAVVEGLIAPLETALLEQEQFAERKESERRMKLKSDRENLLRPYGADTSFYDLGSMGDDAFRDLLEGIRLTAERKEQEKRKLETEAAEARKAEGERLAKLKAENDRLRSEKEAADRKAKEERDAQQAIIDKQNAEQRERDRVAQASIDKANREAAAARAETSRRIKEQLDREQMERDAEAARKRAEAETSRKAALAPDKEKLIAMAKGVRAFQVPEMHSADGINAQIDILERIESLADYIESVAAKF